MFILISILLSILIYLYIQYANMSSGYSIVTLNNEFILNAILFISIFIYFICIHSIKLPHFLSFTYKYEHFIIF